jgi:hypothetical protein
LIFSNTLLKPKETLAGLSGPDLIERRQERFNIYPVTIAHADRIDLPVLPVRFGQPKSHLQVGFNDCVILASLDYTLYLNLLVFEVGQSQLPNALLGGSLAQFSGGAAGFQQSESDND